MMTSSVYNLLGLASRARKIVTGETIITKLKSKDIALVIIASDASDNTKKNSVINVHFIM